MNWTENPLNLLSSSLLLYTRCLWCFLLSPWPCLIYCLVVAFQTVELDSFTPNDVFTEGLLGLVAFNSFCYLSSSSLNCPMNMLLSWLSLGYLMRLPMPLPCPRMNPGFWGPWMYAWNAWICLMPLMLVEMLWDTFGLPCDEFPEGLPWMYFLFPSPFALNVCP